MPRPHSNQQPPIAPTHRGASTNPANRFERLHLEPEPESYDPAEPPPRTEYYVDSSESILTSNNSPDLGFETSINPYRGCEHGCIYCYARPTHEFLGFSAGLDFESRIMVKTRAAELLQRELASPRYQPKLISLSGVTDCYQPIERQLRLTRACLEVLAACRNPVALITKNQLITRDLDLLTELARHQAVSVNISLTTLDPKLRQMMEPRTSPPSSRLATIATLARAGIPVGIFMAPVIPGLNDHEIPKLLAAAAEAGATSAHYQLLRLPHGVADLFDRWLQEHLPGRRTRVLSGLREFRDGAMTDERFFERMSGTGPAAARLAQLFEVATRRAGLSPHWPELSTAAFRRPQGAQIELPL